MGDSVQIVVIGSRKTDAETMTTMGKVLAAAIRKALAMNIGVLVTSGACAEGPDQVQLLLSRIFDDERVTFIAYLPDDRKLWLSKVYPNVKFVVGTDDERHRAIVRELHPAPDNLKDFAYRLHGRNLEIIAGPDLETLADVVYFSAPENDKGIVSGGTAMGVSYARSRSVPAFNAFLPDGTDAFIRHVRTLLRNTSGRE
ncbi:putative DNA recombination-mediator protein A [Erwinia phage vB_EamM_Phobos]|uniref:DprA-like DNA recombination-mediator protein n=1 Tax=Erwinia phage vB_EamM_Phobos TaxID=1883377 RepID=UPI00081D1B1D|nr:DprA-like DNA recombination-mediator protein [Erwinia phage vB_EamM_Phobos]ANZ50279.1 putative DNA recombination-mediator protein A [Erwinia phage vB_EamM_Phobos]